MDNMTVLLGAQAFTAFRLRKIEQKLITNNIALTGVDAQFIYFLHIDQPLDETQQAKVEQLLTATCVQSSKVARQAVEWITVPRIGTISPWSSKATDILKRCDLDQVLRVERGILWRLHGQNVLKSMQQPVQQAFAGVVFDPLIESLLSTVDEAAELFAETAPQPLHVIDLLGQGMAALDAADAAFGFALNNEEKHYLLSQFTALGRNPTDVELMMFAQVNSEHCRHKIFNADWTIDGASKSQSLFSMIKDTHKHTPKGTVVAYSDNAAILEGSAVDMFDFDAHHRYQFSEKTSHISIKVETHNHPTAISPFPGAATGSGGEIRDEGATGRGGRPKAGLTGFSVSHLRLPNLPQPWEHAEQRSARIASPLQIMLEGPIGAAAFNNEFGRPNILGYFRTFEHLANIDDTVFYGYNKPIMLAGGLGQVSDDNVTKIRFPKGTPIVVLGGPTMLIGLGGGAASSVASGQSDEALDFASVQRGNPEMQRRCQEVINQCCNYSKGNPILSIHDVGAGGICNALPELIDDAGMGAKFELRDVNNAEPGMTPMQIWCNESQERYVMAVSESLFDDFVAICQRERCLYAVVGYATDDQQLQLTDRHFADDANYPDPIDLPLSVLFGLPPKMHRDVATHVAEKRTFDLSDIDFAEAAERILAAPCVASKAFLITIGDRSVTGLITRDQMVGPWQIPVADVGVTSRSYRGVLGEAMAVGERTPIAVIDAPRSGRMAVVEAITNIAAAKINQLSDIKLSANWMVAAGQEGQDADLYATVESVTKDLCIALGLSIPVGKDSMSMQSLWHEKDADGSDVRHQCVAPLSLVVSAFAPVTDTGKTLTPELDITEENDLWLIDLGRGRQRLGASVLAQVYSEIGDVAADLERVNDLATFFALIQQMNEDALLLAYHDRSDGGLWAALCEMAFAARCGLNISVQCQITDAMSVTAQALRFFANEEPGAVIQTRRSARKQVEALLLESGLIDIAYLLGEATTEEVISLSFNQQPVLNHSRAALQKIWAQTSWQMQRLRDHPECADEEYLSIDDQSTTGLFAQATFDINERLTPALNLSRPKVAILREQGTNGQAEMAFAFDQAGFDSYDVTMTDLMNDQDLSEFHGLVACGGFSFGDVLGAGAGWGNSILFQARLKQMFADFFNRGDTFALGVCNGCQMFSIIKSLIPGAAHWPSFVQNRSEQYEARLVMTEIVSDSPVFFNQMQGSRLPIVVSHFEGRAQFANDSDLAVLKQQHQIGLQYIDHQGQATQRYPFNPNASAQAIAGVTSADGRVLAMMPHPERVVRSHCSSWRSSEWGEFTPWLRMFENARNWLN